MQLGIYKKWFKTSQTKHKQWSNMYNMSSSPSRNTSQEILRSAFAGKDRPLVSQGLPFPEACLKHVSTTFNASRVYIISSGSLARNTDALERLQRALEGKVVGTRVGMKPHTYFGEVLEIVRDAREARADCIVTLGGGSLADGAKVVALVSSPFRTCHAC